MLDLILKNGIVYDGMGGKPQELDLGIKKGEIAELGRLRGKLARRVIDVSGQVISPGFIDIQNHSDSFWTIFDYPHQQSLLLQGVTCINMGNCGASLAPLPTLEALKAVQKWHSLQGVNFNWQYFDEYLQALSRQPLGVNVVSLVGHSTLSRGLLGDATRKPTAQEFKILERMLLRSMRSGASGLSLGLVYSHEHTASQEELLLLARAVGRLGRLLTVHLRSEGSHILESVDEALQLAEKAAVKIKISHLKVRGKQNWPLLDALLMRLEKAYANGAKLYFDVYPYDVSWNVLYTYLPKWSFEGGRKALLKRIREPYLRKKILNALAAQAPDLGGVIIATAASSPHLVGRTLAATAAAQGVSVGEAILNVLSASESEIVVFDKNVDDRQMRELVKHPLSIVASDGAGFDLDIKRDFKSLVHPRCFGNFVRFLRLAVEDKLCPLETAIHKITGRPAEALNLAGRGVIVKRAAADIAVFDPNKLFDPATLESPFQGAQGMSWVMVNGVITVEEGKFSGQYSGRVLKA